MLAARKHARGAVLRCTHDSDGRRSGAAFCAWRGRVIADSEAVGGTHRTEKRRQFCLPCGRATRPACLLPLLRPERHFEEGSAETDRETGLPLVAAHGPPLNG